MNDTIYSINGPVVTLRGARGFSMMEMVYVGEVGLIGEVIGITSEKTTIQVYEDTAGLKVGRARARHGMRRCAPRWARASCENIFDGIERPLAAIAQEQRRLYRQRRACGQPGRAQALGRDGACEARPAGDGRQLYCHMPGNQHHHA